MKEKLLKSIVVIFLIMILLGQNIIMAVEEIAEEIVDEPKAEAMLETEIVKYHNFNLAEKKGALLQWKVKTGMKWKEGQEEEAIKKTKIKIEVPRIKEQLAERIEVVANHPQDISQFSYDQENGILEVETSSVFEVIAIYPDSCYEENVEKTIEIKEMVEQELEQGEIFSKEISLKQVVNQNIGDIVSISLETQDIYNGYIKSNKANGTTYETSYQEKMNIGISHKEIGENLWITQENSHDIIYKTIKIKKEDMKAILGEEGFLKVIKENGEVLQEIKQESFQKEEEEEELEELEIAFEEGTKYLQIEISKPIKEGNLSIEMTKAIPSSITNLVENKILTKQSISSGDRVITANEKEIIMKDAKTSVEMQINENELTNGNNNNVIVTATLRNNQNAYNLFCNPEIKITLPDEVEKVILGDVAILHGEGMEIANAKVEGNCITITLEGKQVGYQEGRINQGTNIVIPANIILKQELETVESTINTVYTNQIMTEQGYQTEEKEGEAIPVSIINTIQEEVKVEEENTLEVKEEKEITNEKPMTKTINENDIELQSYAQVGDKKLQNGDTVHVGEIIKYVVSVKNTTNEVMTNLDVVCQVPENTVFATVDRGTYLHEAYDYQEYPEQKDCTFSIKKLEPGQTQTGFYEVVVKQLEQGATEKQINNKITAKNGNNECKHITLENKIITSDLSVYLKSYIDRGQENYFGYFLEVKNTSSSKLENIIIESAEFQKEMKILQCIYYDDKMEGIPDFGTTNTGKIVGTIPSLEIGETRTIHFLIEAYNFEDKVTEVPLKMTAKAYTNPNDIYYSNENIRNAYPKVASLKMTSDKEGEKVEANEEVTYQLVVKNESKIRANIHVYDELPKELQGISLTYETYHIENSERGTFYDLEEEANLNYTTEKITKDISVKMEGKASIDEYLEIPAGKSVVMTIKAKAYAQIQTTEVSNYAVAERTEEKENIGIKTVSSNVVKFSVIESFTKDIEDEDNNDKEDEDNKGDTDTPVVEPNSISGLAWLDENQDGRRDSTEVTMGGIPVSLYDIKTQKLVTDKNGKSQKTITDKHGKYSFTNVENGSYWVIFEYDNKNYSVTTYQKNDVMPSLNSDVITKDITIDGKQKRVAMTDDLVITDNGLDNIDIGLVSNRKFNLKLEKYISQIAVATKNGTKKYEYDNTKFTKIEIKAKEIQNSVITITYKIVIQNEGDTEGFASKIVDKIPEGYVFDINNNSGWAKEKDGTVVNNSLSGEVIAPGEKKEISIVLKKTLTGDATGTVTNYANLEEMRSINNLEDNNQEDNSDKAELLISIETGILTYTLWLIGIVGILVIIGFVVKGKIKLSTLKLFMMITVVGMVLAAEVSVNAFSVTWNSSGVYTVGGVSYVCGNSGWHLCAVNTHSYGGSAQLRNVIETAGTPEEVKNTQLDYAANPECYAFSSDYNLVGPYTIRTYENATISSRLITYTENGQVKQSTSQSMMVDKNGNPMSSDVSANINYSFYLKVGIDVEIINEVRLDVTFKDALKTKHWIEAKKYYSCTSIGSGEHQNAKGEATNATAGSTQGMITINREKIREWDVYEDVVKTAVFQAKKIKSTLIIQKRDKQNQHDQRMPNVEFTLKMTSGKYAGQYVSPSSIGNATYHTSETIIKTDANGDIKIRLLEPGTYELTEVRIPYYGYEEMPKVITSSLNIVDGTTKRYYEVVNKRKYVKLSGRVWEDKPWDEGKRTDQNHYLLNTDEQPGDKNDKLLEHVTVRLKDKNNNTVPFKDKDKNVLHEIETDSDGSYTLWDVLIDNLEEYYIEFSYNGMKYESVPASINKGKVGNKAIEGQNRTDYNNQYTTIEPGKALDQNGQQSCELKYDTSDYTSKIHYGDNLKFGYTGQQYPINGTYDNFVIASNTKNAYNGYLSAIKTPEQIRAEGISEIEDINLGVKERLQPDLSLIKDINKVKVTINNAVHVYDYGDRFNKELWEEDPMNMAPQVRYGSKYGNMSYTRAVYPSDVYYIDPQKEIEEGVMKNQLRVKVTYQIGIKNISAITTVLNKIDDYYDEKFFDNNTKIKVGKQIDDRGDIIASSQLEYEIIKNSGYDSYYKIQVKDMNMELKEAQEESLYIQLEVQQDRIKEIVESNQTGDVKLDNIAEIASYSPKDAQGNAYAGIDQDSAPGNANLNDQKTFEDDTDKAPGLKLILQEQRKTDGKVFMDNPIENNGFKTENVNTGKERQGSGIYENGEKGVEGVTVELMNKRLGTIADIYDTTTGTWKKATKTTDENGDFYFEGFIPDEYELVYTWGGQEDPNKKGEDKPYIRVQDYKATIYKDKTGELEWYKQVEPRYSDAKDDYNTRVAIDNQSKLITNSNKDIIHNYTGQIELEDGSKQNLITTMKSTTPRFRVNLEYKTEPTKGMDKHVNHLQNMDFGIIERAKQALELSKRVGKVKVTLANGSVLIDADIGENGEINNQVKYTTYIPKSAASNGQVKMEVDNEILQSANLEVGYRFKVKNISEKDYLSESYYTYGIGYGTTQDKLVTLDAETTIDYLDNNLAKSTEEIDGWKVYGDGQERIDLIEKYGLLAEELRDTLSQTHTVLNTRNLSKKLQPEGTNETTLNAYRVLPSTIQEEDSEIGNDAEIIRILKTGGSTLTTKPGNYIPSEGVKEADEAKSETVTIVPPTGLTEYSTTYILLAISTLGILVGGIILLKKLVLK